MKHIINRILEGDFQQSIGSLDFSCSKIELALTAGEDYQGVFEIYGPPAVLTEGYVYSYSLEMELLTTSFTGAVSGIGFCFHSCVALEGDVRCGEFVIVSNHGEYALPYQITIIPEEIPSSLGAIKNLFHFTNLAKANWEEAAALFYSPVFAALFRDADRQHYSLYRGLSGSSRPPDSEGGDHAGKVPAVIDYKSAGVDKKYKNEHNVEEFLLAVRKKQKIEYLVPDQEIRLDAPEQTAEFTLPVTRNGWGHTCLRAVTEGAFLSVSKETIREEDFLGNLYRLPYYIDGSRLHAGHNPGQIRLIHNEGEIRIPVTVVKQLNPVRQRRFRREHKQRLLELMNYYVSYRTKKISLAVWRRETTKLVERMIAMNDQDLPARLFRAQLLITEERFREAEWILNRVETGLKNREDSDPALWCYHCYLVTLCHNEEGIADAAAEAVYRLFLDNRGNWRIAWLLLYLREEYDRAPAKKWRLLEDQFKAGCNSPILYVEALHLLLQYPALLLKMERFEIQLLLYGIKIKFLSKEIITQTVYLLAKARDFSRAAFRLLQACYQLSPSAEAVKAICSLLIKGNKTGSEYLTWYRLGIEQEIRVTRLFEHYLMSVDLEAEERLPKMVLMYFAYNSNLDYHYRSYLYTYIDENRDEYPELYENYRESIAEFILQQAALGHINQWLAYLYEKYITPGMITGENAAGLAEAFFTVQIDEFRKPVRELVVIYRKEKEEITYRVNGGKVLIPLYGSDYCLFLEDAAGNRYVGADYCRVKRLFRPDRQSRMAAPLPFLLDHHRGFDLWLCEKGEEIASVTPENLEAMERLLEKASLAEPFLRELRMRLLRFYFETDDRLRLDQSLEELRIGQVEQRYYEEILRMMIARCLYPQALEWLKQIGGAIADAKLILRILNGMIPEEAMSCEQGMLALAEQAFTAGKYDEKILNYLNRFYNGAIRKMRDIWRASGDFGVDTYELSGRLLVQMLFSGSFVGEQTAVFREFVSGGGHNDLEMAFINQSAYDYFVKDKVMDAVFFRQMERIADRGGELQLVCKLAFVKYYAENSGEITEGLKVTLEAFLRELVGRNIYFGFYKDYIDKIPYMERFLDKTIIEYRAKPGNRAVIHYLLERDPGSRSEYVREEMKEMYGGVCAREFVLFYGERLQYYIAETEDGNEFFTESASTGSSGITWEQRECKFRQINDIEVARSLQDYETADSLLHEYMKQEFMVSGMFEVM